MLERRRLVTGEQGRSALALVPTRGISDCTFCEFNIGLGLSRITTSAKRAQSKLTQLRSGKPGSPDGKKITFLEGKKEINHSGPIILEHTEKSESDHQRVPEINHNKGSH